jgi:hypothetical protein
MYIFVLTFICIYIYVYIYIHVGSNHFIEQLRQEISSKDNAMIHMFICIHIYTSIYTCICTDKYIIIIDMYHNNYNYFLGSNHFIEQLKEEISSKDNAIVKEHFMHHSVTRLIYTYICKYSYLYIFIDICIFVHVFII